MKCHICAGEVIPYKCKLMESDDEPYPLRKDSNCIFTSCEKDLAHMVSASELGRMKDVQRLYPEEK